MSHSTHAGRLGRSKGQAPTESRLTAGGIVAAILAAGVVWMLNDGSEAAVVETTLSMSLSDAKERYDIAADGYYHLSESYVLVEMRIDEMEETAEKQTDTELPDRANGEYNRIKVMWSPSGDAYIRTEHSSLLDDGDIHTCQMEGQVEFINGDSAVFAAGDNVTTRYTEESLEKIAAWDQKETQDLFCRYLRGDSSVETCNVSIKRYSNSTFVMNTETIYMTADGPIEVALEMTITTDQ